MDRCDGVCQIVDQGELEGERGIYHLFVLARYAMKSGARLLV